MNSDDLIECINSYKKLMNVSYNFIIGRKNNSVNIILNFTKKDFFHLAGLQYLTDLPELKSDREIIFNRIEADTDFCNMISNSDNFFKLTDRISLVTKLEDFFDSNKTVFKYNNKSSSSKIQADFLLKNEELQKNLYVYISKADKDPDTYFCRSAFPRDKSLTDYAAGHTSYTLLYKTKTNLQTDEASILYTHPAYAPESTTSVKI